MKELLPEAPNIRLLLILLLVLVFLANVQGKTAKDARIEDYEGRQISAVELVIEGSETPTPNNPNAANIQADLVSLLKIAANTPFSAVRVRESLQALFDSGRVGNARVEVVEEGANRIGPVRLRFVVKRQVQIGDVRIELGPVTGTPISADELRARLNFVQPGTRLSQQLILRNADEIQVYLRDRGYFNATVNRWNKSARVEFAPPLLIASRPVSRPASMRLTSTSRVSIRLPCAVHWLCNPRHCSHAMRLPAT